MRIENTRPVLYRALLCLLPRARRERFGDQMALVFDDLRAQARRQGGAGAAVAVWLREVMGLFRFSMREIAARAGRLIESLSLGSSGGRWNAGTDVRLALRSLAARPWRAVVTVGLLSIVLAANTIVFTLVDALALNKATYPEADRLVQIQTRLDGGRMAEHFRPGVIEQWQEQSDLFSGVGAWSRGSIFITRDGTSHGVGVINVTPNTLTILGASPAWGRPLRADDAVIEGSFHVLVSESLARQLFGRPEAAVGRRIDTSHLPMVIVGVMPAGFRFPDGAARVWRALSLRGPLVQGLARFETIARLAPAVSRRAAADAVRARGAAVGVAAGLTAAADFLLTDSAIVAARPEERSLAMLLLGGAGLLLIIACANVAGVEAAAIRLRSKRMALQRALGATRGRLAANVLLEGAVLMFAAVAVGSGLAMIGLTALLVALPPRLLTYSANSIDVDLRSLVFMAGAGFFTWLMCSLPGVMASRRTPIVEVLARLAGSSTPGRQWPRRALAAIQIGAVVVLLVGGADFARAYLSQISADRGFDGTNLAVITASFPNQAAADRPRVIETLRERLQALDGIEGVVEAIAPPGFGEHHRGMRIAIDGRVTVVEEQAVSFQGVDSAYFHVLGARLVYGRFLRDDDPPTAAVVSEGFARTYWPGLNPTGRTFSIPNRASYQVVGVVGDMRDTAQVITGRPLLTFAFRRPPTVAPRASEMPTIDTGGSWGYLSMLLRLDSRARADAVIASTRDIDPRFSMELAFVDDSYRQAFGPYLLGARLVGVIGFIAFFVAPTGVYGVMACLVGDRSRELGVRTALGASGRNLARMVLSSAARLTAVGCVGGGFVAVVAMTFVRSTVPGLTGDGLVVVGSVVAVVLFTALVATWHPARQAARVDPAVTLRSE